MSGPAEAEQTPEARKIAAAAQTDAQHDALRRHADLIRSDSRHSLPTPTDQERVQAAYEQPMQAFGVRTT